MDLGGTGTDLISQPQEDRNLHFRLNNLQQVSAMVLVMLLCKSP